MLVNIQFLRFVAALLVVIYHANQHVLNAGADPGIVFRAGESAGFAGVDVFFVISGFIMYYTSSPSSGPSYSLDFLKRRIARIYSGYWPFFLLAAGVIAWARPKQFASADLLTSFFLWPNSLDKVLPAVSWTLSYEMYFYLLFSLLVLLGVQWRWRLSLSLFGLALGFNLYLHFVLNDFSAERIVGHGLYRLFLTSPFLIEFFAGALCASITRTFSSRFAWALMLSGILGFTVAGIINVVAYQGNIEQGYYILPRVLLFGMPSVLMLLGMAQLERNGHVAPRQFSLYAGGASYAIYLSHTIFLLASKTLGLNAALTGLPDTLVRLVFFAYCAMIVVFSVVYYRRVERPVHRSFKRALKIRRPA